MYTIGAASAPVTASVLRSAEATKTEAPSGSRHSTDFALEPRLSECQIRDVVN